MSTMDFPRCTNCGHLRGGHRPVPTGCLVRRVSGPATENHDERLETPCGCPEFMS